MASWQDIITLHQEIVDRLKPTLERRVTFIPDLERTHWDRLRPPRTFIFHVRDPAGVEYARRRRGVRYPVLPLTGWDMEDDQPWAGWYEEWKCMDVGEFELVGASWTFYWGKIGRLGEEQQIFRAEWDQVRHRGERAAQPHWHFDAPMVMTSYAPRIPRIPPTRETEGLEELPSAKAIALEEIGASVSPPEVDVSGIHLGMGGWRNGNEHPVCWQLQVEDKLEDLAVWCERSLRLAREQFSDVRGKDIEGLKRGHR